MAACKCPQCLAAVPAGHVVAFSDRIECPGCKTPLEVSALSRGLATFAGLAAAALVWRLTKQSGGILGFVLPVVYTFLAYSIVAPLVLMFIADLRNLPAEPAAEPAHSTGGHSAAHH